MSLKFYDEKGKFFFERTAYLDLKYLHDAFAELLPKNAHILDSGCGSGRDAKAFIERGYQVTAFDGSATMVKLASEFTGLDVQYLTFEEMNFDAEFDAVWANASLLHVPKAELPALFPKFLAALKPDGLWFMSFKLGEGERKDDFERHFTFFTEQGFQEFIAPFSELKIEKLIITQDNRPQHEGEKWLNAILRKT